MIIFAIPSRKNVEKNKSNKYSEFMIGVFSPVENGDELFSKTWRGLICFFFIYRIGGIFHFLLF